VRTLTVCVEENVDMPVLLMMTESHLKLLKLPIGHRIRLMRWLGLYKRAAATQSPNATDVVGPAGIGTNTWTFRGVTRADLIQLAIADVTLALAHTHMLRPSTHPRSPIVTPGHDHYTRSRSGAGLARGGTGAGLTIRP
jgi:hypothetical protein